MASESEDRHRERMPWGGIPHEHLLAKLEATDPDAVAAVRGRDAFYDVEDEYDDYARAEVIDWAPDAPFLESDHTRRDPALSRSVLNLHYNGTRGSNPELPRHPELFLGFTGDDPRGAGNDPRFDQVRGHASSRAERLAAGMGNNDDNHVAERPWTGQAISYDQKRVMARVRGALKVFSVSKEGRPWGRGEVANPSTPRELRAALAGAGGEGFADGGRDAAPRFAGGDHGGADREGGAAPGGGRPPPPGAPGAWRHAAATTAPLGAPLYGLAPVARGAPLPSQRGAARARGGAGDSQQQAWGASAGRAAAGRAALGAALGRAAARRRAAVRGAAGDQAAAPPSAEGFAGGARLAPSRDPGAAARRAGGRPDQEAAPPSWGSGAGLAAGLAPARDPAAALRAAVAGAALAPSHLAAAAARVAAGLREGSAAGKRRAAGAGLAAGVRAGALAEKFPAALGRGPAPGSDPGRAGRAGAGTQAQAAVAGAPSVAYRPGALPSAPERRAALAAAGRSEGGASGRSLSQALGRGAPPGDWRGGAATGAAPGAEVAGFGDGAVAARSASLGSGRGPRADRGGDVDAAPRDEDDFVAPFAS